MSSGKSTTRGSHGSILARKSGRLGDLLVLAEEAPVAAFRAEA